MTELYTRAELTKNEKICAWLRAGFWMVIGAGLIACILMCLRVNTLNARKLMFAVMGVSTVCGWAAILLYNLLLSPLTAEVRHARSMLDAPREAFVGQISVEPFVFRIPHSISARRVKMVCGEETRTLHINARLASRLPAGRTVRVEAARQFVAAFEEAEG